ncbi:hypothetical protein CWI39_3121p0010 [Hamiltosporidium magnivora]|uniref:Uncharacterized protein n=1 Tax=Hamiltosporidium magnivora TaxID=148818 RepID=A0A4Q9KR82_9MICR|nr:hypothetical protein CWI39_3121p0010 [Hamiltosporidium magnivora]
MIPGGGWLINSRDDTEPENFIFSSNMNFEVTSKHKGCYHDKQTRSEYDGTETDEDNEGLAANTINTIVKLYENEKNNFPRHVNRRNQPTTQRIIRKTKTGLSKLRARMSTIADSEILEVSTKYEAKARKNFHERLYNNNTIANENTTTNTTKINFRKKKEST